MSRWLVILLVSASAMILISLVIMIIVRSCYSFSKQGTRITEATITTKAHNKGAMEGLRSQRVSRIERTTRSSYNLFRRGSSTKPLFCWADHPSLIADAVENGWSRFAFMNSSSGSSQIDVAWEIGLGSVDFMQKIRMNSGLKNFSLSSSSPSMSAKSAMKTSLPLPGPPLGNSPAFPQVAYFEITILRVSSSIEEKVKAEGEKTKLIHLDSSENANYALKEMKLGGREAVIMSVGLTSSSVALLKIPGSYHGSIGFNSDGSVNLDGIRLTFGSEKLEWGREEKVIGCGFDPRDKKVYFTVDSELVHMVHCKSDEFGVPLYPVIAANADITMLVNLGQSRFSYEPMNAIRTPNPCFLGPLLGSPAGLRYEDSGELFSMGRIDSDWHNYCTGYSSANSDIYSWHGASYNNDNDNDDNSNRKGKANGDGNGDVFEADLFDIVVDIKGKSQNI